MFILSKNGDNFINYNHVITLKMVKENYQYGYPDKWWEIRAIHSGNLHITVGKYYTPQDCKDAFSRLCNKISNSKENEVIDVAHLFDD